jgi:hypothetical protein
MSNRLHNLCSCYMEIVHLAEFSSKALVSHMDDSPDLKPLSGHSMPVTGLGAPLTHVRVKRLLTPVTSTSGSWNNIDIKLCRSRSTTRCRGSNGSGHHLSSFGHHIATLSPPSSFFSTDRM